MLTSPQVSFHMTFILFLLWNHKLNLDRNHPRTIPRQKGFTHCTAGSCKPQCCRFPADRGGPGQQSLGAPFLQPGRCVFARGGYVGTAPEQDLGQPGGAYMVSKMTLNRGPFYRSDSSRAFKTNLELGSWTASNGSRKQKIFNWDLTRTLHQEFSDTPLR